jgi:hypothetical protein
MAALEDEIAVSFAESSRLAAEVMQALEAITYE